MKKVLESEFSACKDYVKNVRNIHVRGTFLKKILELFVGPLIPLFWTSGDVSVGVSRGYTDHYQGRGQSSRLTATLINIHEPLI